MGRGTILSGGTAGQYQVSMDFGSARVTARVAIIDVKLATLAGEITAQESELVSLQAAASAAVGALNTAIDALKAAILSDGDLEEAEEAVKSRTSAAATATVSLEKGQTALKSLQAEKVQLERAKSALLAAPVSETRSVWCVDYTENASGEVATIEIPGEPEVVLIAAGGAAASEAAGEVVAREVLTPEAAFFNGGIFPGWQKWLPTYRVGTIGSIDYANNTCSVTLDVTRSSAQRLDVNQTTSLAEVAVEYMACHASAFEDGDKVVVQFVGQDWGSPKVIGFAANPQPCAPAELAFYVYFHNLTQVAGDTSFGPEYLGDDGDSASITYPEPGFYTLTESRSTSQEDPSLILGNLDYEINHVDLIVRFDVGWERYLAEDEEFERVVYFPEEYPTGSISLPATADTDLDMSGTGVPTISITSHYDVPGFDEDSERDLVGGDFENRQVTVGRLYEPQLVPPYVHVTDPASLTSFMATLWDSPPSSITLGIDGVDFIYSFSGFAPVPFDDVMTPRPYGVPIGISASAGTVNMNSGGTSGIVAVYEFQSRA